jgi:hypothetical protein
MARSTVAVGDGDRHRASRFFNLPIKMTMQDEIRKATNTLHNYMPDNVIEGKFDGSYAYEFRKIQSKG